jgi:hypothetical protein
LFCFAPVLRESIGYQVRTFFKNIIKQRTTKPR